MKPKFIAFVRSLCHVLVVLFFVVACFGLSCCLDVVGPDPECTDLQLAYFGVGLFAPLVLLLGSYILCELFNLVLIADRRVAVRCQYRRCFHAHRSGFFFPDSSFGDQDSGQDVP